MKMKLFYLLTLYVFITSNSFSNDLTYYSTIGYGKHKNKGGAEIGLGVQIKPYEKVNIDVAPLTGIFIPNDNSRYAEETTKNKQTICRDKTNGQFTDKSNCGASFKYGFETSAKYQLHINLDGGVGIRVGNGLSIYAVAHAKFNSKFGFEMKLGNEYLSFALRYDL